MSEKTVGADHPQIARLLLGLAAPRMQQENYAEAETCLAAGQAIQDKAFDDKAIVANHPDRAAALELEATLSTEKTPSDPARAAQLRAQAERSCQAQHNDFATCRGSSRLSGRGRPAYYGEDRLSLGQVVRSTPDVRYS